MHGDERAVGPILGKAPPPSPRTSSLRAEVETLPRGRKIQAGLVHLLSCVGGEGKPWGCWCGQPEARGPLPCPAEPCPFIGLGETLGKCRATCLPADWGQGEAGPELPPPAQMAGSLPSCETGTTPHTPIPTSR